MRRPVNMRRRVGFVVEEDITIIYTRSAKQYNEKARRRLEGLKAQRRIVGRFRAQPKASCSEVRNIHTRIRELLFKLTSFPSRHKSFTSSPVDAMNSAASL